MGDAYEGEKGNPDLLWTCLCTFVGLVLFAPNMFAEYRGRYTLEQLAFRLGTYLQALRRGPTSQKD